MKQIILFAIAILLSLNINAQQNPCATPPVKSEWLKTYQQNPGAYQRTSTTLYVPLTIHLVGRSSGSGHFPVAQLMDAFCTLQNDFAASNIQFFIEGEIRYINNDTYYEHTFLEGAEMMEIHNIPNTINCYIVGDPAGACGYYSPWRDGIANAKSCMGKNDHTWAHEIGHFLTLPHTFFGWEGVDYDLSQDTPVLIDDYPVEKTNGSNCQNSADGFCDTPADYLSYRWACNSEAFSNQLQRDPDGVEFRSDGSLFMSYSFDACGSRFSEEQIGAMRADLEGPRASFLYNQNPPTLLGAATPALISPIDDDLFGDVSSIELNWEALPNADGYFVDLDLILNNGNIFNVGNYHTNDNTYIVTNLVTDKNYRWRIRPYNLNDGCTIFSEFETFTTGNIISGTNEIPGLSEMRVFPTPQKVGQVVNIEWSMERSMDIEVKLVNLNGQLLQSMPINTVQGENRTRMNTTGLSAGVYVVIFENELGRSFQKLILN
jgi:hypothetical protein